MNGGNSHLCWCCIISVWLRRKQDRSRLIYCVKGPLNTQGLEIVCVCVSFPSRSRIEMPHNLGIELQSRNYHRFLPVAIPNRHLAGSKLPDQPKLSGFICSSVSSTMTPFKYKFSILVNSPVEKQKLTIHFQINFTHAFEWITS